jgi:arylsulfatase
LRPVRAARITGTTLAFLWAGATLACQRTDPSAVCPGYNVVLITIDTLRADHLGVYGYPLDTSPRLGAYFARGAQYTAASCAAPCTPTSVQQILTGSISFPRHRSRLAEILAGWGYATAAVASQHLFRTGGSPDPRFSRGFEHFDLQGPRQVDQYDMTTRTAREVTDRALDWLRQRERDRPFFLWLHYFDPHDPYDPPRAYRPPGGEQEVEPLRGDVRGALRRVDAPGTHPLRRGFAFSPGQVASLVRRYDGEISFADAEVGRFLQRLEETGLSARTIAVLTSDHGEWLGEEERWGHCQTLHGRELDVPLLLRAGDEHPGPRGPIDTAVSTLDIVPTVLELLGIPTPVSNPDSRSLLRPADRRIVFASWVATFMARDEEFKLYVRERGDPALYRLGPGHEEILQDHDAHPRVRARLAGAMVEGAGRLRRARERNRTILERLRTLGYID